MISLRSKIILSLVSTSMLAIGLMALLTMNFMRQEFDSLVVSRAAEDFVYEAREYYREYGSWEVAMGVESLFDFAQRLRARELLIAADVLDDEGLQINPQGHIPPTPWNRDIEHPIMEGVNQDSFRPPPLYDEEGNPIGPPPGYPRPGGPPPGLGMGPGFGMGPGPLSSEVDGLTASVPPPAPFSLINAQGEVILAATGTFVGEKLSDWELGRKQPILLDGETIGYIATNAATALTEFEAQFLAGIQRAWWQAFVFVLLIALPVGILLGNRLASPIARLNSAIKAMSPSTLAQRVPIKSKDELGQLSENFNRMSTKLAATYADLEKSRKQIANYAEQMREISLQDALTLLPNRRAFNEQAPELIGEAQHNHSRSVIALIDIDNFKVINDNYSHSVGDYVLGRLAFIMKSGLRETDLIARYGGEEFAILFPETDLQTSHQFIEKIRASLEEYIWKGVDEQLRVTMSAGLVEVPNLTDPEGSLEVALKAVDIKLYEAKNLGRNRTES